MTKTSVHIGHIVILATYFLHHSISVYHQVVTDALNRPISSVNVATDVSNAHIQTLTVQEGRVTVITQETAPTQDRCTICSTSRAHSGRVHHRTIVDCERLRAIVMSKQIRT